MFRNILSLGDLRRFCSLLPLLVLGCVPLPEKNGRADFYNAVLDQIIYTKHYQHCFEFDSATEKRLANMAIDEAAYVRIDDSLKVARKKGVKKCALGYRVDFENYIMGDSQAVAYMEYILKDSFLLDDFAGMKAVGIADTLTHGAPVVAGDLAVGYLDIVPYSEAFSKGDGMGWITLSRAIFNKDRSRAVLYYEFVCGAMCGRGEVVRVDWENGRWVVKKFKNVWIS